VQLSDLSLVLNKNGLSNELEGPNADIRSANTLEEAGAGEITFLSNPKYLNKLGTTQATAVIVGDGVERPDRLSFLRAKDPYAAITGAIIALHGYRAHPKWGISPKASVDPTARLGSNANIGPGATVCAGAVLGDNCTLYPGAYVGDQASIGSDCTFFPNVVVYDHSVIGNRVTIHAGSVIGEDGLGYAPIGEKWIKIPQVGRVEIGDDVEIGANCAIDRATLGRTQIGAGTKFGNVIVIGHGTRVGPDCLFVGLVGLAGSVTVGRHVTVAGQAGMAGHITIGDNVQIGAQSGVRGDVEANAKILGAPAVDADDAKRMLLAMQRLPDWIKRVKSLEREIAELRAQLGERISETK
jgi:UDP-3-O-[3-hydroxymyristoyl] glucosamine N-acyltransferase